MINRYSASFLLIAFFLLAGSFAKTEQPILFCAGQNPSWGAGSAFTLRVVQDPRQDLVQMGRAMISHCGQTLGQQFDLGKLNGGASMVLPAIVPGKNSVVFRTQREETLEIQRWTKKDQFEGAYQSPNGRGTVTCQMVKSFPSNVCDFKVKN